MKKALKRNPKSYWYWKDEKKIFDKPNSIVGEIPACVSGDLSGVWGEIPACVSGDLSGVWGEIPADVRGNLSGVWGNLSGVSGNLSDVSGNLSGVSGNLDDCGLTDEEREAGVKIEDLIGE